MKRRAEDYPFYDIPGPIAVAHRGGHDAGAKEENSLAAIESAKNAGITYVEVDVIDTADGHGLLYHDARNRRDAKRWGLELTSVIQSQTLDEIRSYLKAGSEEIPTIEEVLATFPDLRIFIDIKTKEAINPVVRDVERQRAHDRVSLGSFNYKITKTAAELLGGQERIATNPSKWVTYMLNYSGVVTPRFLRDSKATSLQPVDSTVSDIMIERARDLGWHVIVWPGDISKGNDNRQYLERNLARGVHGIISNYPSELVRTFTERGHHSSISLPLGGLAIEGATA